MNEFMVTWIVPRTKWVEPKRGKRLVSATCTTEAKRQVQIEIGLRFRLHAGMVLPYRAECLTAVQS